jgi:hypothetical protein
MRGTVFLDAFATKSYKNASVDFTLSPCPRVSLRVKVENGSLYANVFSYWASFTKKISTYSSLVKIGQQ